MNEMPHVILSRVSERVSRVCGRGGVYYTFLYIIRSLLKSGINSMDGSLVKIEQRKRIVEGWSISAKRFTVNDNKNLWNSYDWSQRGEEWTPSAEWKQKIISDFLIPYVPEGGRVLEIGPGGGRWTEFLLARANKLFVLDVSDRALALCRERFTEFANIEYLLASDRSIDLAEASIDAIWSYDVFVHINPVDARSYFKEFARLLKPGGYAVIHHPGAIDKRELNPRGWRSDLTENLVDEFILENSLNLVSRTFAYVNPGDALSVISKSGSLT
jgi:SAM-dependent methyltransferase